MSAPANLAAFLDAAARHQRGDDHTIAIEYDHRRTARFPLKVADLRGVLDRLAEVCPDHKTCEACSTALCTSCGIGDPATCEGGATASVHCDHPDCWCRHCARTAGEDAQAEALADATGGRF